MARSKYCSTLKMCLPEGLGPDELTEIPADDRPDGLWFYHTVNGRSHFDRRYRNGEFIPHHSGILKQNMRWRTYAKTVGAALRAGWVESDGHWVKGVKSIGFRPSPVLRERQHRFVDVHCPRLAQQQARRQAHHDNKLTNLQKYLKRMLGEVTVTADAPTVSIPMMYLAHRQLWFEVCAQNRVHTNITSLERTLRRYLRWRGLPLWQTDIGCSQALILGLVYERETGRRAERVRTGRLCDFLSDCLCRGADGLDLHAAMARRLGVTRAEAKAAYWLLAYGSQDDLNPRSTRLVKDRGVETKLVWGHYIQAFEEAYPNFFRWVRDQKPDSRDPNFKDLKGQLARQMQTLESALMIDGGACEDIRNRYPGACLLTLHDCLISTEDHIHDFKSVVAERFWREYKIRPVMKDERFGGP